MAIPLEFYSLIIRRDRLEMLLPGGWKQFIAEYGEPFPDWFDENIVRFGAMNSYDIEQYISHFKKRGLKMKETRNGRSGWRDMFLHAMMMSDDRSNCDWLRISDDFVAEFVGERLPQRRKSIRSPWSDELSKLSYELIFRLLSTPPENRAGLSLKNWESGFAHLTVEDTRPGGLILTDRSTGETQNFRSIEDLLNGGWAVD